MHFFFKGHFDFSSEYYITSLIFYSRQKNHFIPYLNLINVIKDGAVMLSIRQQSLWREGPPFSSHRACVHTDTHMSSKCCLLWIRISRPLAVSVPFECLMEESESVHIPADLINLTFL